MPRHLTVISLLTAVLLAMTSCTALDAALEEEIGEGEGEGFPNRTITMIVGFAPGGGTDVVARTIAPCMSEHLGTPVVVENKPGGSQAVGINEMLDAEPDGHTMALVTTSGPVVVPLQVPSVGFDKDDVTPLNEVTMAPSALIAPEDVAEEVGPGFLDERDETLIVATPGALSAPHLIMERLRDDHGASVQPVPFDGSLPALTALQAGDVDAVFTETSAEVMANVEANDAEVLVSAHEERIGFLPEVPTFDEIGYTGLPLSDSVWFPIVPAETPDSVVGELEEIGRECVADPEVEETLGDDYLVNDRPVSSGATLELMERMYEDFLPTKEED